MSGVLVVVPMRVERAALARRLPGALRVGWGPRRWSAATTAVRAALDRGDHCGLLVVGVCGAVTAEPVPGDVVVASELRGPGSAVPCAGVEAMAVALAAVFRRAGRAVHIGPVQTVDHVVGGAERAALAAGGALAVDTESAVLAAAAGDLPVLAVRAVSDTPDQPLRSVGVVRNGFSALRTLHAAGPALASWSPISREVG